MGVAGAIDKLRCAWYHYVNKLVALISLFFGRRYS